MRRLTQGVAAVFVIGLALVGIPGEARAATLNVENHGVDGVGCGTAASPCRTIGFAVAAAVVGDEIVVGPGRYGDVNADGLIAGAAEEKPLVVDKALTVRSSHGAGMTVFDAGNLGGPGANSGVRITASGATFGRPRQGFTVTRASNHGIEIAPGTSGVRVEDNVATANGFDVPPPHPPSAVGIMVQGDDHVVAGNVATATLGSGGHGFLGFGNGTEIRANLAVGNGGDGFQINGHRYTIDNNVARDNGSYGWEIIGDDHLVRSNLAADHPNPGFEVAEGTGIDFRNNVASGNTIGFAALAGTHSFTGNVAVSNRFYGFELGPNVTPGSPGPVSERHRLGRNSAIGNGAAGVRVAVPGVTVLNGSLFGNGVAAGTPTPNCGLEADGVTVVATGNFWGDPAGPGPADPADETCGTGAVTTAPVAAGPAVIGTAAGRNPTDPP